MRQVYHAEKSGDWANHLEVLLGNGKRSVWRSVKVRDCNSEVGQADEGRQSIVQDMQKSMDLLRQIIVPVEGQKKKECHFVVRMPSLPPIPT